MAPMPLSFEAPASRWFAADRPAIGTHNTLIAFADGTYLEADRVS